MRIFLEKVELSKIKKVILSLLLGRKVLLVSETLLIVLFMISFALIEPQLSSAITLTDVAPIPIQAQVPQQVEPILDDEISEISFTSELNFSSAAHFDAEKAFYISQVRNYRIVEAVYSFAADINKDFIFALIEYESCYDPRAVNENINKKTLEVVSVDRGLFQLNSKSYPDLEEAEFFQIETNVRYGIAHIRGEVIFNKGNLKRALWTYNAGRNGILDGVPTRTLKYATDILARTKELKSERERFIKDRLQDYAVYSTRTGASLAAIPQTKGVD